MATKPEFLIAKEKMLVALETVSVAISSPVRQDIKSGCFRCVVQYHSMWAIVTFLLHLVKDAHFPSNSRLTEWAIILRCVLTPHTNVPIKLLLQSREFRHFDKKQFISRSGVCLANPLLGDMNKKIMFSDIQDKPFSFKWHRKTHYQGNHFLHESFTTTCCWIS